MLDGVSEISHVRYYKQILLIRFGIRYAFENSSEGIGEQEGCDEFH